MLPALALTDEGSSSSSEAAVVALDPRVFAVPVRRDIVHRLVVWQVRRGLDDGVWDVWGLKP